MKAASPRDILRTARSLDMAPTTLNLPPHLRDEAEQWASRQGVSLDEFIVWAVAEKVGGLKQALDDPRFPHVTYRRGASGWPVPVLRGTAIRVQTIIVAAHQWHMSVVEIAQDHGVEEQQVRDALAFYEAHRAEIDASLADEERIEGAHA
jgi:uncharacterized protein (DUF433 family)